MLTLLAFTVLLPQASQAEQANALLQDLNRAISSGVRSNVESMFAGKEDAAYLFEMGQRRGGLRNLKVSMIPAPPGWEKEGPFWAVLSTRQDIEDDHDTLFPVIKTMDGMRLGREIPETFTQSARVEHSRADAILYPSLNKVVLHTDLNLKNEGVSRAPVFRLNVNYSVDKATVDGKTVNVFQAGSEHMLMPSEGDVIQAGGLLIYWSKSPARQIGFDYSGIVKSSNEDKIDEKACYITAWWIPTISRLPHPSTVRVQGPKDWVIISEGNPANAAAEGFEPVKEVIPNYQTVTYKCDIPISYPKIIGGKYVLAGEKTEDGRTYRSYQFEPVDKDRAEKDLNLMADAARFYDKNLGPFPFSFYDCFDADTYYGIESYSYTLLDARNTTKFVTHEMGHTYFGGLVPCSYTKDTWNESLTQYVDSVLFGKNADRTLQAGVRTLRLAVPLSKMSIAHEFNSATYYRGAYVMRMLENEIGQDAVLAALKDIVATRRSMDTTWADLRPYFEKSSHVLLDWFWAQWIDNATFPKLELVRGEIRIRDRGVGTDVTVRQMGTANPFRLKYKLVMRRAGQTKEQLVTMSAPEVTVRVMTDFVPTEVALEPFEYSLVDVGPAIPVK